MAKSTPGLSASKGSAQTIPNRGFGSSAIFRPQPRPPFGQFYGSGATNFYRRPSYSYGVPTGLGALLSGQQSPFGRMVDPATGFPQRSFPRPVMGRPDFGRIGRGKIGMGGARTVTPEPRNVQISDVYMDAIERAPMLTDRMPRADLIPARPARPVSQTPEEARQPQPTQIETPVVVQEPIEIPSPVQDFTGAPPPMMDASQYLRTDQPMMRSQGPESLRNRVDSNLRFGEPASSRNADGSLRVSQPIMPRRDLIPARPARPVSQTPEEAMRQRILAGNRRGTGLDLPPAANPLRAVELMPALAPPPLTPPRLTAQERTGFSGAMEQAGVRPNIRPTMNVGKATGGPVGIHSGIASLVGRR